MLNIASSVSYRSNILSISSGKDEAYISRERTVAAKT